MTDSSPVQGPLHVRGRGLPDGEPVQWWIADGVLRAEPLKDARTVWDGGWIIPGLVDAHCHVGLGPHGGIGLDEAIDAQRALAAADPTRRREAFWAISDMALRRFDDETASSFAEQAVELGPDDPAAQARWAALLRRLGRLGDAPKANCTTCHQGQNKPLNGVSMLKDYQAELGGGTP